MQNDGQDHLVVPFPVLSKCFDKLGAFVKTYGAVVGASKIPVAVADRHDGGCRADPDNLYQLTSR